MYEDIIKVISANTLVFIIYITNAFKVITFNEDTQVYLTRVSIALAIIYTLWKFITDIIDRINKNKKE